VQIVVTDLPDKQKRTVAEVRQLLRGGVLRYDNPFEPCIPDNSWEMLK
jgi:hypothetical protein